MTTRVMISVESGENVKVEVKGRKSDGTFTEAAEVFLGSGECAAFTLHSGASLQLFEAQENMN